MNRRTLLSTLASLPFCGWLKPRVKGVCVWSETPGVFTVAAIGFNNESSIGRNAILFGGNLQHPELLSRYIAFNCKRELRCLDTAYSTDFESIKKVGWGDDLSLHIPTKPIHPRAA